jgi:hypothetical protein
VLVTLKDLGDRIDRLDDLANKGIHAAGMDPRAMHRLLIALVVLASDLLSIDPPPLMASNVPYERAIRMFAARLATDEPR